MYMQAAPVTIARQRVSINISSAKESLVPRSHPPARLALLLSLTKEMGGRDQKLTSPVFPGIYNKALMTKEPSKKQIKIQTIAMAGSESRRNEDDARLL